MIRVIDTFTNRVLDTLSDNMAEAIKYMENRPDLKGVAGLFPQTNEVELN